MAHAGALMTKQPYRLHRKQDDADVSGRGCHAGRFHSLVLTRKGLILLYFCSILLCLKWPHPLAQIQPLSDK